MSLLFIYVTGALRSVFQDFNIFDSLAFMQPDLMTTSQELLGRVRWETRIVS